MAIKFNVGDRVRLTRGVGRLMVGAEGTVIEKRTSHNVRWDGFTEGDSGGKIDGSRDCWSVAQADIELIDACASAGMDHSEEVMEAYEKYRAVLREYREKCRIFEDAENAASLARQEMSKVRRAVDVALDDSKAATYDSLG